MKNQVEYLFYGLTRNSQNPLDPRFKINSLSTIDSELLPIYRYNGLIFHVKDINKMYLFLNDLVTPISLQSLISNGQINAIISNDYSTLIASLNATNPTIGSLVTVYPLKVTFIFNGTTWEYHSGNYNVASDAILLSIPSVLCSTNKLILLGTNTISRFIFKSDLTKSTEVIITTEIPLTPEQNRYYDINGILYLSIDNKMYKLSQKYLFLENFTLNNGITSITHNLKSTYISGEIWINMNNGLNDINKIVPLTIEIDSTNPLNKSNIISSLQITGNILLKSNT